MNFYDFCEDVLVFLVTSAKDLKLIENRISFSQKTYYNKPLE